MITKKVCMIGAFSVGKTALVERFVHSIFSDTYLSTVGVKISKKNMETQKGPVNLVIWDLEGRDDYGDVNLSYVRGAMGVILVADGTREETLSAALDLHQKIIDIVGEIPYVLLINKYDLLDDWEITPDVVRLLQKKQINVMLTSARSNSNVNEAFLTLSEKMIG